MGRDYRADAYEKASKKSDTAESPSAKIVRKPLFDHISTASSNANAPSSPPFDAAVRTAASALTSGGLIKVPTQSVDGKESAYRKVAKFLLIIGVDEAAKILPLLSEEQTERIIPEIASIRHVDDSERISILAEFQALTRRVLESGGVVTAKNILEKAFGQKRASEMLQKAVPDSGEKPFAYLDGADTERILFLLKNESTATRALVLSRVKPATAASIINALPDDEKADVIGRLAKISAVSPEVVRRVNRSMREKYMATKSETESVIDGSSVLAEILKRMPLKDEQNILNSLTDDDTELGTELRKKLFTIDDVINADDRVVQEELRLMDNNQIAILITGKPAGFRSKILQNVSTGRGDSILEQEQICKPVHKTDSEKVTSLFFGHLREKYENGSLYIKGRGDDTFV